MFKHQHTQSQNPKGLTMKKIMMAAGALAMLAFGACKKDAQQDTAPKSVNGPVVNLPSGSTLPTVIPAGDEYVLAAGGTYFLNGKCYVDSTAKITINAGVTIKGIKKGTPAEASALIVTRGATIDALGTSSNPITFTSNESTPAVGDWGGVVIMGRAQHNQSFDPTIEGIDLPSLPADVSVRYGSTSSANNTESSGRFYYVRILYAGAAIADGNELNSLTLGGVGSGTELHHVEAAYGQDDSFEFFGGTVNAKYLVSLNTNDDIFDFDLGYQGTLQYILGVRRATGTGASYADANGVESDNNAGGTTASPRTRANISNMTLISGTETGTTALSGTLNGARLRRATSFVIKNSVLLGYINGVSFEGGAADSIANFTDNFVHGYSAAASGGTLSTDNVTATGVSPASTWGLSAAYGEGTLAFRPYPVAGTPIASGADFSGTVGFETVTYRGAFPAGSKAWINTWTVGL